MKAFNLTFGILALVSFLNMTSVYAQNDVAVPETAKSILDAMMKSRSLDYLSMSEAVNLLHLADAEKGEVRENQFKLLLLTIREVTSGNNAVAGGQEAGQAFSRSMIELLAKTPAEEVASHHLGILQELLRQSLSGEAGINYTQSQTNFIREAQFDEKPLQKYISSNEKYYDMTSAVGTAMLDMASTSANKVSSVTKNFIISTVGVENISKVEAQIKYMREQAGFEQENFMMRLKSDPMFLAQAAVSGGTLAFAIATGRHFVALGSLWSLIGDRIMVRVPINEYAVAFSMKTIQAFNTMRDPQQRQQAIDAAIAKMQGVAGSANIEVISGKITSVATTVANSQAAQTAVVVCKAGGAKCMEAAQEGMKVFQAEGMGGVFERVKAAGSSVVTAAKDSGLIEKAQAIGTEVAQQAQVATQEGGALNGLMQRAKGAMDTAAQAAQGAVAEAKAEGGGWRFVSKRLAQAAQAAGGLAQQCAATVKKSNDSN